MSCVCSMRGARSEAFNPSRAPQVPFCIHGGLGLPALISAYFDIQNHSCGYEYFIYSIFVLAALELSCMGAPRTTDAATLRGSRHRHCFITDNSKTFPIPPMVQVLALPLPRLGVRCGCTRCFWLRVPL